MPGRKHRAGPDEPRCPEPGCERPAALFTDHEGDGPCRRHELASAPQRSHPVPVEPTPEPSPERGEAENEPEPEPDPDPRPARPAVDREQRRAERRSARRPCGSSWRRRGARATRSKRRGPSVRRQRYRT